MSNHVSILLDESGSMSGNEQRVVTGINEYISKLQFDLKKKKCSITLNLFQTGSWRTYYDGPISKFVPMTPIDYQPGSTTPLYDSLSKTISQTLLAKGKGKRLIIVDTDGMENASHEITKDQLQAQMDGAEAKGMTFVFLGADMAQFGGALVSTQSMGLNIPVGNVGGMSNTNRSAAYSKVATSTTAYFSDPVAGASTNFLGDSDDSMSVGEDSSPDFDERLKVQDIKKKGSPIEWV